MSLSALFFVVVFVVGLLLAFYKPVFGLCTYIWVFYNNPADQWWGTELPRLRWSIVPALVTLLAFTIFGQRAGTSSQVPPHGGATSAAGRPGFLNSWGARLFLLFVAWIWIENLWAIDSTNHFNACIEFTKFAGLYFLLYRLMDTPQHVEMLAWTHVVGAFTWAWAAFRTDVQGRYEPYLGPAVDDANVIGFYMISAVAFAGCMFISMRGWKRWVAFGTLPFFLNTIILTASRSAFLGLLGAGIAVLWLTPRDKRWITYGCAAFGVVLFLQLANSDLFWERINTLFRTDVVSSDSDFRLTIASANWRMFADHPWGAGLRGNVALSPSYVDARYLTDGGRSAHSTFLAVLVDTGAPGTAIFFLMCCWALVALFRLKQAQGAALAPLLNGYLAAAGATMAAFFVTSQFVNQLVAEVWIWTFALLTVLISFVEQARQIPVKVRAEERIRLPKPTSPRLQQIGPVGP